MKCLFRAHSVETHKKITAVLLLASIAVFEAKVKSNHRQWHVISIDLSFQPEWSENEDSYYSLHVSDPTETWESKEARK